jgi:hypothetical protein
VCLHSLDGADNTTDCRNADEQLLFAAKTSNEQLALSVLALPLDDVSSFVNRPDGIGLTGELSCFSDVAPTLRLGQRC